MESDMAERIPENALIHFAELAYALTKLMARGLTHSQTLLWSSQEIFLGVYSQAHFVKNMDDKGLLVGKHGVSGASPGPCGLGVGSRVNCIWVSQPNTMQEKFGKNGKIW